MEVQVISSTVQKFNGVSYYKCGNYFQRKGVRLHREVWKHHNGDIPDGYDIHHEDGDSSNNDISNLKLMCRHDHHSMHMKTDERIERSKEAIEIARKKACEWHGSDAGKEYHSKLGKANWKKREAIAYTCTYCGKEFHTKHIYGENQNRFCHNNCKSAYRRMLVRNGVLDK